MERRILYIDASSEYSMVALQEDGAVCTEYLPVGRDSSAQMAEVVSNFLKSPPDAIAYGEGPGSFTGLRVAAALASALSLSYGVPLMAVSALYGHLGPALLDARSGGVYAFFDGQICKMSIEEAAGRLNAVDTVFSPHTEILRKRFPEFKGVWIEKAPDAHLLFPLIEEKLERGEYTLNGEVTLNYL